MMSSIGKAPKDLLITNDPKEFERWISSFKNYVTVIEINRDDPLDSSQKHALLLNCIGEDASRIIEGLSYKTATDPFENLVKTLTNYFVPKANTTFERYTFRNVKQTGKVLPFLNELQNLSKKCDFDNYA